MLPKGPVILAPRGMLSQSALKFKGTKKLIAITVAKMLGLYHGVIWQASSQYEAMDIQRIFGEHVPIIVAPDISLMEVYDSVNSSKNPGALKVIFLSRISREKNLDEALRFLSKMPGDISFDIYGPINENAYWQECKKIISTLPGNITVKYHDAIPPEQVHVIMKNYELFFLPTLGENFGHVILEAMLAGCPVLISDQTPWRNLAEKGVGWDIPLNQPGRFYEALQHCINMDEKEHQQWCERAQEYAKQFVQSEKILEQNRQLFYNVLQQDRIGEKR
jgi:glycosyltransferase involved in cell wall biosynthesis